MITVLQIVEDEIFKAKELEGALWTEATFRLPFDALMSVRHECEHTYRVHLTSHHLETARFVKIELRVAEVKVTLLDEEYENERAHFH